MNTILEITCDKTTVPSIRIINPVAIPTEGMFFMMEWEHYTNKKTAKLWHDFQQEHCLLRVHLDDIAYNKNEVIITVNVMEAEDYVNFYLK